VWERNILFACSGSGAQTSKERSKRVVLEAGRYRWRWRERLFLLKVMPWSCTGLRKSQEVQAPLPT
jgi:hypothetical protein